MRRDGHVDQRLLGFVTLGLVAFVERTNRLGRTVECGILRIDNRLGHNGHHALADSPAAQFVTQHLLHEVADRTLGLGSQHVERQGRRRGGGQL